MLNSEWGNLVSWEYWKNVGLPKLKEKGNVVLSISGRDIQKCVELAKIFDNQGVSIIEFNVSCSHSGVLYGNLTDDQQHVARLVTTLKKYIKTPLMIKLGWSPLLPEISRIAEKAGVDAIATTNSIGPGLDIQLENGKPQLGIERGIGGLSGKSIFPIALECVHQVVEAVNIPVMGIGGIGSYKEVLKMLMVGATCVQIYTEAFLRGPKLFSRILKNLSEYLRKREIQAITDIQGLSRPFLNQPSVLIPQIPIIEEDNCPACGVCPPICPVDAIEIEKMAVIDANKCIGCGICVQACPPIYSAIKFPSQAS